MNLYEIIQALRSANGTIAKQAILDANKDNELFKAYMKAVYDVGINYYQKKAPKPPYNWNLDWMDCLDVVYGMTDEQALSVRDYSYLLEGMKELADRKYTGDKATKRLKDLFACVSPESRELMTYILDRKIGASVGDTMVLKTWPDLYFLPPYQRCSLLDKKARERFGKLKRFFVQTKADGSFAYVVKRLDGTVDVITRQGSKYPQWFAEKLTKDLEPGSVLVGELLVDEKQDVQGWGETVYHIDRKTANGLLNSALKDGEKFDDSKYSVRMEAWDFLSQQEFEDGKSNRSYEDRFNKLCDSTAHFLGSVVSVIFTAVVGSLEEAFAIYQEHLQRGLEGCIIKDPASLWKDGTSKDIVKLKIKFEVEMRANGMYEGEGKAAGMLGGIYIESEDHGIQCACGSGFSDAQRREFWEKPWLIDGFVVAIEANDITQSRDDRKKPALSLPIFIEVRNDKTEADTTERIYAQLEAAKQE